MIHIICQCLAVLACKSYDLHYFSKCGSVGMLYNSYYFSVFSSICVSYDSHSFSVCGSIDMVCIILVVQLNQRAKDEH